MGTHVRAEDVDLVLVALFTALGVPETAVEVDGVHVDLLDQALEDFPIPVGVALPTIPLLTIKLALGFG